jgi:hypothetical protein
MCVNVDSSIITIYTMVKDVDNWEGHVYVRTRSIWEISEPNL